jgi:hypothetical protein
MTQSLKSIGGMLIVIGFLLLAGCAAPPATVTPTIDLNPLRTEVAATVLAQVTQDLARTPSLTPLPSATATLAPSDTSLPPQSTASPTLAATPTQTITPTVETADRAEWVSQTVLDGSYFATNQSFTNTWTIKNVGTTTWTANYLLRFFSGNAFGAPSEVPLGQEVPPGETIDISLRLKAPPRPGDYRSDWVLSNEARGNFKDAVYLEIVVVSPGTLTATAPTRTPTTAPTLTPTP